MLAEWEGSTGCWTLLVAAACSLELQLMVLALREFAAVVFGAGVMTVLKEASLM